MRYHWGLAVGHVYTHESQGLPNRPRTPSPCENINNIEARDAGNLEKEIQTNEDPVGSGLKEAEEAEFGLESRDPADLLNALDEQEEEAEEAEEAEQVDSDYEEHMLAMEEMYGS